MNGKDRYIVGQVGEKQMWSETIKEMQEEDSE